MPSHSQARMVEPPAARSIPSYQHRGYEAALRGLGLFGTDCLSMLAAFGGGLFAGRLFGAFGSESIGPIEAATNAECLVLLLGMFFYLAQQGRYSERIPFWSELRALAFASLISALAFSCLGLMSGNFFDRTEAVVALLLFPAIATVANHYAKALLSRAGLWEMRIVVVGNGESATRAEAALNSDRSLGLKVVRRVHPALALEHAGSFSLKSLLQRYQAQSLLIAVDGNSAQQKQLMNSALQEGVPFTIVPEADLLPSFSHSKKTFFGHNVTLIIHNNPLSKGAQQLVKATLDVTVAAILILFLSPVFLIVAALTCMDGGPVIFGHTRIGAGGRPFRCLKFRTMVVDADKVLQDALAQDPSLATEWRLTRKLTNDPRVTPLGRILRKTSLDELPQLFNILMLDMSLVGPRPIVESEVQYYGDNIAHYIATRPGLTGLWQVSGRSDTTYAQRVQLDVWYVNNWTVWSDIIVLLKTFPAVIGAKGAR